MKNLYFILLLSFFVVFGKAAKSQNQYYYNDSVTFETPTTKIIIDTGANNLWQIGTPHKLFFDSAYAGQKAIVTDTINSYTPNNRSSFIYIIRAPYTYSCYTGMSFWHRYEMDSLHAKGIIEASYDGGNSWVILKDTNQVGLLQSSFWWDGDYHEATGTYTPHLLTITGKSDGWIQSTINWQWWWPVRGDTIITPVDSLMIQFTFISDSSVNNAHEGWMIDEIVTSAAKAWMCSGIEEHQGTNRLSVYPNPFTTESTIKSEQFLNNATLTLYNSLGETVYRKQHISGQKFLLLRNGLPHGLYTVIITEKGKITGKGKIIIGE